MSALAKLKQKASVAGKLAVICKKVKADAPVVVEEVVEIPKEDDVHGFEIQQLLINLGSFTVPGKYDVKDHDDKADDVSVKLLRCIKKVQEMTSKRKLSAKLQSFLLEWLHAPPGRPATCPLDQLAFVQSRKEFFQTYRAETRKWEGKGCIPDSFSSKERSDLQSASVAASNLFPDRRQSTETSWKQDMAKVSRGSQPKGALARGCLALQDLHPAGAEAEGFPEGSATASSPCISKSKSDSHLNSAVVHWAGLKKDNNQLLAQAVGKSVMLRKCRAPEIIATPKPGYFEMLGPRRIVHRARAGTLTDNLPLSSSITSFDGCSDDASPISPLSDSCPLCVNRSVDFTWEDPPDDSRRIDIGRNRMRKPQPGGAAMEHARKVASGRMRLLKPMLEPLEMKTATPFAEGLHPYGRSHLEAICTPNPKCEDMPLLVKSASESAFVHKDPPPGGHSSKRPAEGLFAEETSAKTVQRDRWRYFKECDRLQLVPRMPDFLLSMPKKGSKAGDDLEQEEGAPPVTRISVKNQGMRDPDLETLLEPLRGSLQGPAVRLDLSQNMFSDKAMAEFLKQFPTRNLTCLNLSSSGAASLSVDVITRSVEEKWTKLNILQLAGQPLSDNCWEGLCNACVNYATAKRVDLVDMELGRRSQDAALRVAHMASSSSHLEHLDISGNYIFYEGFEALGDALRKTKSLRVLDVSNNAATQGVMKKRQRPFQGVDAATGRPLKRSEMPPTVVTGPNAMLLEEMPVFHPAALLVEALSQNKTLTDLRLASSFIDFTVDCSILLAVLFNTTIERIDLSDNPHGEDGLRALLRLVVTPGLSVEFINVANVRGGGLGPGVKHLEFGAPGGRFDLDFGHPQHRAIVRWLLRTAVSCGIKDPAAPFTIRSWTGAYTGENKGKYGPWYWSHDGGGWDVPTSGRISFDYAIDLKLGKQKTSVEALRKWSRIRRVPVTLSRFVPLLSMFEGLTSSGQKDFFMRAMSDTCLLKICHLMKFAKAEPEIAFVTVPLLYPHLLDPDQLLLFDVQHLHRHLGADFRKQARTTFFWNTGVPTNQYVLHLSNPMDKAIADRLHVVNMYDAEVAIRKKVVDTSQYGNYEGARNVRWEGAKYKCFMKFHIPTTGALSLDYVSPIHCSPTRKNGVISGQFYMDLVEALQASPCGVEDKVSALRLIAHCLVVDPKQVYKLCLAFPSPSAKKGFGPVNPNIGVESQPTTPTSPFSPTYPAFGDSGSMEGTLASAFQSHVENGRAEMFVLLFTRCVDVGDLCNYEHLWNPDFLSLNNAKKVRDRLGFLRTQDVLNLCRPYGVPQKQLMKRWELWQINEALMKARRAEAEGTTKDGVTIDGATTIVHEPGRRYVIDLAVYEERRLCCFLMRIADWEDGMNLVRCDWTERGNLGSESLCDFFIPGPWHTEEGLPKIGVFSCTYMSENQEFIQIAKRIEAGERFLGWEQPSTLNLSASQKESLARRSLMNPLTSLDHEQRQASLTS